MLKLIQSNHTHMELKMNLLNKINSPDDIKSLSDSEINVLAGDIRQKIIEVVSQNGGHLASNLGIVEATIALHKVFSFGLGENKDSLIFDVGHQCYAHKLITGRYSSFETLRKNGGISGFTNRGESTWDTLTAGHSGSSVSAAIGIAEAMRIKGSKNYTVAVVGDGSFTNGMIYEALNSLARRDIRLIIVLNDNEMSISKNVGSFSNYLSLIRTGEGYFKFKFYTKKIFSKIPLIGMPLVRFSRRTRDLIKRLTNSESFFENLGLEYIGPVNGNDFRRMVNVLEEAKTKNCPVIVHMKTKKGLGFAPAEEHPEKYHSTSPFSVGETNCANGIDGGTNSLGESAKNISSSSSASAEPETNAETNTYSHDISSGGDLKNAASKLSATFTAEVSRFLCDAADKNGKICAVTAAMTEGCGLGEFAARFPERFFDVGIAEEHAVTMAGGLAIGGMIPFVVLYSTFSQRVFDQLWHDIVLQNAHVVLFLSHCGLVAGDGVTHQGIYDVPLFSTLPQTEIFSPDTPEAFAYAAQRALNGRGLSIVRYPKGAFADHGARIFEKRGEYKLTLFGNGEKNAVITYGRISEDVSAALFELEAECGLSAKLIVLNKIYPLPDILSEICATEKITVIEESVKKGGIGEKIAALSAEMKLRAAVRILAIEKDFIPNGDLSYLKRFVSLDRESIKLALASETAENPEQRDTFFR